MLKRANSEPCFTALGFQNKYFRLLDKLDIPKEEDWVWEKRNWPWIDMSYAERYYNTLAFEKEFPGCLTSIPSEIRRKMFKNDLFSPDHRSGVKRFFDHWDFLLDYPFKITFCIKEDQNPKDITLQYNYKDIPNSNWIVRNILWNKRIFWSRMSNVMFHDEAERTWSICKNPSVGETLTLLCKIMTEGKQENKPKKFGGLDDIHDRLDDGLCKICKQNDDFDWIYVMKADQ